MRRREYPATFGWSELASLRRSASKLIAAPSPELYDLDRDPGETVNVLTVERRAYRDLTTRLDQLRATAVASTATAVDAETRAKLASLGYVAPSTVDQCARRAIRKRSSLFSAHSKKRRR